MCFPFTTEGNRQTSTGGIAGVDFNAALVREGYARAVRGFAYTRRAEFIALEDAARSRGVGLWAARAPE